MCGVQIQAQCAQRRPASWCDRAELTLSQTSGMDDNDYRTLAALRGRLFLALGRSRKPWRNSIAPSRPAARSRRTTSPSCTSCARARMPRSGNYPAAFTDQGEYLRAHARTGHARSHSRSGAAARAVRERPGKAEDRAAREGQEARRGTAQQPDAHHAARGHRRPHRPRDRVLPRATRCSPIGGIAPNSSGSPSATNSPGCSTAAPSCARPWSSCHACAASRRAR